MTAQHARPHGLFLTQDAERLATREERSAVLPARGPFRRMLRRLLGGRRRAPRHGTVRGLPRYREATRAGSPPSKIYPSMLPPLEPLPPRPWRPVDVDEPPRAIPQVAAMVFSLWLPVEQLVDEDPVEQLVDEDPVEQLVDEDPVEFVVEDLAELRWSLCPCGERWGPCLLAEVAAILHYPLVDPAVDSIVMAAVR